MKKVLVLSLVLVFVLSLSSMAFATTHTLDVVGGGEKQEISTGRTVEDYVNALKELVDADRAGDIFYPEEDEVKYLFVPLYKEGELIGYGSWVNTIIYSHPEDFIAVLGMANNSSSKESMAVIKKWKPLDANDHHPEMKQEEFLSRYYGMSLKTSFEPEVDIVAGSTISSHTFFFEMKNMLLVFENFGPEAE
ncbi:hypothetical protein SAMN04488598_11639 [Halanaerobium congolense]|jgi:hypothetical protein|uniref:FMN-binding domain-containing protein n=1 Tax=Halanaerobium congolense TaxID=54121 RepID=A0A1I0AZM5_9FIRM|nr:hypothetical protein [Halanaerobium congolense]PTX16546.1 hypothetical protein C7953_1269 [Halanaerobium congolense]TDP26316.1 hypothetical protein C8C79_10432 [Halanaerobium congolense]SDF59682.1 hypothetical protein SAMN04488598_11639 [Halanaerobium congolense]SES99866.1 hypothetical protein SAMN04515652_11612 [Halanaerobium congolense]SFP36042.1 hypothetical protein SAMN04488596_11512 [Halanaerobium congolense]